MNKGYSIVMYLVIFNLCTVVIGGLMVFNGAFAPQGAIVNSPIDRDTNLDLLAIFSSLVTVASAVGLSAITRSVTPIGIGIFTGVFIVTFFSVFEILRSLFIPDTIINVFLAVIGFVFCASLIQMATGVSLEGMA